MNTQDYVVNNNGWCDNEKNVINYRDRNYGVEWINFGANLMFKN